VAIVYHQTNRNLQQHRKFSSSGYDPVTTTVEIRLRLGALERSEAAAMPTSTHRGARTDTALGELATG
jgi:hypothetical protein